MHFQISVRESLARRVWKRLWLPTARRWKNIPGTVSRAAGPRCRTTLDRRCESSARGNLGTARLEEAVAAYRGALEEYTRDRVPLDWAMTQNNLGNALLNLGAREPGTARLEEAVAAYRAALEERTRDRVPLDWARTQNNLGIALRAIGSREPGTARLEEAVAAHRAVLEERTRNRVPLDWATTKDNLGRALTVLGTRTRNLGQIMEAKLAFEQSCEITGTEFENYCSRQLAGLDALKESFSK